MRRRLQEAFGKECSVTIHHVTKNNSVVKTGLAVNRPDAGCSPVLYLEQYYCDYQKGIPEDVIIRKILDQYHAEKTALIPGPDIFRDTEYLMEHVVCRIVGQAGNESLLRGIPFRSFLDLAVIYYLEVELEKTDQAACMLNNEMLSASGITASLLDQCAVRNTKKRYPCKFISMYDMLCGLSVFPFLPEEPEEKNAMYVLTNSKYRYGAFWMSDPDELSKIAGMLGESYYILPSSVHECIVVRGSASPDEDVLCKMVSEINASCVSPEEVLADAVYYYRIRPGELARIR